jgi:hypothetical protein
MNAELERIWNEAAIGYSRYHLDIHLKGLRKTTKTSVRIAGISP